MNDDERDGDRQASGDVLDDVSNGHVAVVQILTEVLTDILVRDPVEVFQSDAPLPDVEKQSPG